MEGAQLVVSVVALSQRSRLVLVPCKYGVPPVPVDTPAAARSSLRIVPAPGYSGQVTDVRAVFMVRVHLFRSRPTVLIRVSVAVVLARSFKMLYSR